jgi:hypothetical protein
MPDPASSPLSDYLTGLKSKAKDFYNRASQPGLSGFFPRRDTSYMDDMVRKANESARAAAAAEDAKKAAARPAARKPAARTAPRRAAPRAASARR